MNTKKIIHIDMDAFFASVEQRDNPDLQGKPIAVGFDGPRGVVSTASYEARKYGVHSAMSIAKAKTLCGSLIIIPSHFDKYKNISKQIHDIFKEYTDIIEPISLDEAFLDVTTNKKNITYAKDIACEIKEKIKEKTGLTASAGVSYNKFLSKVASDYNKPNGLCIIHPNNAQDFIDKLAIEKFWGIGPKTAAKMHKMGIFTGAQLREVSQQHLKEIFGKAGLEYYNFSRGQDEREVITERERKSVGCEQTFLEDISTKSTIIIELYHTVIELERRIANAGFEGKTLTLKIKYYDFSQVTRSITTYNNILQKKDILLLAKNLLKQCMSKSDKSIRLLGLSVSKHSNDNRTEPPEWREGYLPFEEDL